MMIYLASDSAQLIYALQIVAETKARQLDLILLVVELRGRW